jgi:hypothetical protein
VEVKVADT